MVQTVELTKCFIVLTNTAREAIKEHFTDEHAFFSLQSSFFVFLEKQSIEETSLSLTIYFDNRRNEKLSKKMNERVVILDCVFDIKNGLIAKSFRTKGKHTPVDTNRRKGMRIHFVPSRINGHSYSEHFIKTIAQLPVAQEKYDYVNKRISSWEGYLKVLYKNANIDDIEANIQSISYSSDFSTVSLKVRGIHDKEWKSLKGMNAYVHGIKNEIGEIVKTNIQHQTIEIELAPQISKLAKENVFDFHTDSITFSNASTKSQLNRLLKGFDRLKEGLAANPNLENFLFEDVPNVAQRNNHLDIEFHNNLNKYQREAVRGALEAEDLFVIQGPPGTGKTTVISEICYQNVKMGLRTLIASQSNLAVDNALGRLLANKDIRILRYGRTESIEEEGKKFIEENVAEYWKTQTFDAISKEINQHEHKEELLQKEIEDYKTQIEQLTEKVAQLERDILRKKEAEKELKGIFESIAELKKQIISNNKEKEKTEKSIETLQNSLNERTEKLREIEETIASKGLNQIQQEIKDAQKHIRESENLINYVHVEQKLNEAQAEWQRVVDEITILKRKQEEFSDTFNQLQSYKKLEEVEGFIETHGIKRGFVINQLLLDMDKIYQQILKLKPAKQISERIEKAIEYNEKTLKIQIEPVQLPPNHQYSLHEVNEFLDKLALAFKQQKINRQNGIPSIRGLYIRRLYVNELLLQFKGLAEESKTVFEKLKMEVAEQYSLQLGLSEQHIQSLSQKEMQLQQLIQQYHQELKNFQIENTDFIPSIDELQVIIDALNEKISSLTEQQANYQTYEHEKAQINQEIATIEKELSNGGELLSTIHKELKELHRQGIVLEKKAEQLQQLIKQNPEFELEQTKEKIKDFQLKIEKLHQQIELLPITKEIQKEWFSLLNNSTEHDLDEIRKLYVKHANVIGTTCVASANKDFMDNYPIFDVVIIDEVSKATPPELLLPMLKGKKIILVGDHHQLPPLIGDDTFEETLEVVMKESDTFEEKRELEKLLEESLFERLYKNLPSTNKKMLGIQYRMHEKIMQTITPFYRTGNESLHCGLDNSDEARDHKLNGNYVKRHEHLLWFDLPNEPHYFEERMKEGASLFNSSELETIRKLLIDLNEATAKSKEQGLLENDALKSVGVISFYREQVNRVNLLIEELNLSHLHIRTGSVDKFQGMEMDVILLSMVRNNPHGEIGFAKDYRRLNVALSRARELLMIIGSSEMFMNRPKAKNTKEMYQYLYEVVEKQQGIRKITKETFLT
ncbi:DEAD/DEAH box helicase [Ureibacillus thermosphaericus]|uniref:Superfamily I DNA and/or RNA helicase n=1 Tax=Ureibacillus thermosphaericus TaxID=51173 RepID=A0A840PWW5_URETH|nr:AAA domain-containing protein [Ureibacillus thermosphaericus]MBB5148678.1 superfamily I DNA and/or RNA helicase [Ureibacillus thermosphaericus]NKZ31394.1 AAA family ATPase [Ureibacillus thermosphaericus]